MKATQYSGQSRKKLLGEIRNGVYDIVVVTYDTLRAEYNSIMTAKGKGLLEPDTLFRTGFHRTVLDEVREELHSCCMDGRTQLCLLPGTQDPKPYDRILQSRQQNQYLVENLSHGHTVFELTE